MVILFSHLFLQDMILSQFNLHTWPVTPCISKGVFMKIPIFALKSWLEKYFGLYWFNVSPSWKKTLKNNKIKYRKNDLKLICHAYECVPGNPRVQVLLILIPSTNNYLITKGVFAKNGRGYGLMAKNKRFFDRY